MKKIAYLLAATCLFLAACKPTDDPTPTPGPETKDSITAASGANLAPVIGTDGGSVTVSFNASGSWTAAVTSTRADGWVSITPASGSGNGTITIKADANNGFDDRYADIQVKCGTASLNVSLTQKQKDAVTLTSTKFEVGADGGAVTIEVKANVDFNYEIEAAAREWISKVDSKSYTSHNLTFDIAPNEGTSKRNGAITFTSGSYKESVIIYQEGSKPSIILSDNEITVGSAGEVIKIDVTHNVDVDFSISGDWIKEDVTKAMSTNAFYFTVEENTGVDGRTGAIKFFNKDSDISETVVVSQLQCDAIDLDTESVEVSADEGQFEVNVGSNVIYSIDIDAGWIRVLNTKAYESRTVIFAYDENVNEEPREAEITFSCDAVSKTITVKQEEAVDIKPAFRYIEIPAAGQEFTVEVKASMSYDIEISKGWVKEIPTRTVSSNILTFSVLPNDEVNDRLAVIRFVNYEEGGESSIDVHQLQKNEIILVNDTFHIPQEGDIITVDFGHNIDVTVKPDVSWIKEVTTKSFDDDSRLFEVLANDSFSDREGHIAVVAVDDTLRRLVTVFQDARKYINVTPSYYHCDSNGGSFTAKVESNVDYTVSWGEVPWISLTSKDEGKGEYTFTISKSGSSEARSTDIVFADASSGTSASIKVEQDKNNIFYIDSDSFYVDTDGGEYTVGVVTNGSFSVNIDPAADWIHILSQTASSVTFEVDPSPAYSTVFQSTDIQIVGESSTATVTARRGGRWHEGFEKTPASMEDKNMTPTDCYAGWTNLDADGDGYAWYAGNYNSGAVWIGPNYSNRSSFGNWTLVSFSYGNSIGALTPDNWLITPAIELSEGQNHLSFWINPQDENYTQDHYSVYIGTSDPSAYSSSADILSAGFELIFEETLQKFGTQTYDEYRKVDVEGSYRYYYRHIIEIPAKYSGQKIYLAFRHHDSYDWFVINLDNIDIYNASYESAKGRPKYSSRRQDFSLAPKAARATSGEESSSKRIPYKDR